MIRPITDVLRHIGGGTLIDEASDKLSGLVATVDSQGGTGKITIELSIKKATRGGAMHLTGQIKVTKPKELPMEALMFATPEGNLVADDPNQMKLDLKTVVGGGAATPITLKTAEA